MITKNGIIKHKTPKSNSHAKNEKTTPNAHDYHTDKNELVECNNRLERYIASQRAKDQKMALLEDQIEELRKSLTSEKERIRASVKSAFDKLRNEKNRLKEQNSHLRNCNEETDNELKKSLVELRSKSESLARAEKRLFTLIKKRERDLVILNRLNGLVHKYRAESGKNKEQLDLLLSDNENLRSERDDLSSSLQKLKNKREEQQADAQFSGKTYKDMVNSYEKEIGEMKLKMNDLEDSLRVEFAEQLDETLKARQKNFNEEKDKAISELSKIYEGKIEKGKTDFDEITTEVEELRAQNDILENKCLKFENEKKKAEKSLQDQTQKVSMLEEKITALKLKPIRKEQHHAHVLKLMKEAYRKKEAEVEAEREEKIALTVEINSYRDLLDKEEKRQKVLRESRRRSSIAALASLAATPTPKSSAEGRDSLESLQRDLVKESTPSETTKSPKKRKRSLRSRRTSGRPEGVEKKTKNEEKKEEEQEDFILECYATLTRIEVKNQSESVVNVGNWVLRREKSEEAGSVAFPEILNKNEAFYVYPTEELLKEDSSEGVKKVWNEKAFESGKGSVAIVNEAGLEMYKMEMTGKDDESEV